jgi:hypothetical protein
MKGWGLILDTALATASNKRTGNWHTIFILNAQWYVSRKSPYGTLQSDTSLALTHPLEFFLKHTTNTQDFSSQRFLKYKQTLWNRHNRIWNRMVQISLSQNICITHIFRVYVPHNESEYPNEQNLKWRKIKNKQC